MALEAGTKLGYYEILSPLEGGGMGEVYLADYGTRDHVVMPSPWRTRATPSRNVSLSMGTCRVSE